MGHDKLTGCFVSLLEIWQGRWYHREHGMNTMRPYEMMFILRSDIEGADDAAREKIVKSLLPEGFPLKSVTHMGKKSLAYDIKRQKDGQYILVEFEAQTFDMASMEKKVKLTDSILRYLVLQA